MIEPFPERYARALGDQALRRTLLAFQRNWRASRDRAVSEGDFEASRVRLAAIKDEVIDRLPYYLDRFQEEVEARGATVFRARGGEDATQYVTEVARHRGVKSVIKSKSMLSEEIGLNVTLEQAGLHVVETDLGEWIVQLAGERPSHITGPALHKNRRQVAELLARVTGRSVSATDIGEQVAVAREALREQFLAGEMGISGANALVAETGSIVLVTNEGNAELVTSLPDIHIVIAGIEKLLPTLESTALQLQLLAPSATGQPATSYVSYISPPAEAHRELHIVLVDNGRTAMRESELFRHALRCIRCGACSSVCPAYGVVGGHVFGYVYSGAIGLVNTPFHHGLDQDAGPQNLCVSCNACGAVCPVDIPLPRQILDTRAAVVARHGLPLAQRLALDVWSRPRLFTATARLGAVAQLPVKRGPFLDPPGFSRLTDWRKPPALARQPYRDTVGGPTAGRYQGGAGALLEGVRVAYFVQCLTDWLYPEMAGAIVEVLRGLGASVTFPRSQHCCGLPALDSGVNDLARRMAQHTMETLEVDDSQYVVSGGTSCVVAIRHDYPHLFRDDPRWRDRALRLGERTFDFTTFLQQVARLPAGLVAPSGDSAAYHYFCQSYNVLGVRDEPRQLLEDVCGLGMQQLPEANVCCGFGGSVSLRAPEMCSHILARKVGHIAATPANTVITDNPGCIMHLRGGLAAAGSQVDVRHTAEVVAERLRSLLHQPEG